MHLLRRKRTLPRRVSLLTVSTVTVLAAIAVSGAGGATPAKPKPAKDQTLNYGVNILPILDPAFFGTNATWTIQDNLFVRLTSADPKTHQVTPALATSWTPSNGNTVWTFKLRHDAKFADGKPITSADVKYSLVRAFTPVSAGDMQALGVTNQFPQGLIVIPDVLGAQDIAKGAATTLPADAIRAPNKYTIRITLGAPRNDLPQRLANPSLGIVEAANVAATSAATPWWYNAVASGPFKMVGFVPNTSVSLAPNPYWFGDKPLLKRVNFNIITNIQTAEIAYQAGSLDFLKTVYSDVNNLSNSGYKDQLHGYADNAVSVLLVNRVGATANPSVVKALTLALDKKTVAQTVLAGLPRVAQTFTPPQWPGYSVKGYKPIAFDPNAAKAELAKSGLNPSSIVIHLTYSASQDPRAAQAIAQMWQQTLGINVQILTTPPPANASPDQAVNVQLQAQGPTFVAPCSMVQRIKDILITGAGANNVNIQPTTTIQPALDDALNACYQAPASQVWSKVMAIETLNQQFQVFVPVLWNIDYFLVKPYVKGVSLGPYWNIGNLSKVWIAEH